MDRELMRAELVRDEGIINHAYRDSEGYWTIGVGRLIDGRRGGGITDAESLYLLDNDIDSTLKDLNNNFDWFDRLSDKRQRALINMRFNLGMDGLKTFKRTIRAFEAEDYEAAAREAKASKWAYQVGARAIRIHNLIKLGR